MNSSAIECSREMCHALTCEHKVTRPKKSARRFNMMGKTFNAFIPHYLYNYLVAFPLLIIVRQDNNMPLTTLKDFSASKQLSSLGGNGFEPIKGPMQKPNHAWLNMNYPAYIFSTREIQGTLFNLYLSLHLSLAL